MWKDYKTYGGSFLYHVGGGQPLVSVGFVVSRCLFFTMVVMNFLLFHSTHFAVSALTLLVGQ